MSGKKLCYEALSKIPKRFIDEKTEYIYADNYVILANPKYAPMIYKKGKWKCLKFTNRMTFSEVIANKFVHKLNRH